MKVGVFVGHSKFAAVHKQLSSAPANQMHRSFVVLTAQARLALPQDDMAIFFFEIRSFGARKILRG
jgi:hypothetical protein